MERTRRVRLFSSYFEIAVTTKMLQESWRNGCNCGKSYVKIRSRQLDYTCFHKYRFERWKVWRKELCLDETRGMLRTYLRIFFVSTAAKLRFHNFFFPRRGRSREFFSPFLFRVPQLFPPLSSSRFFRDGCRGCKNRRRVVIEGARA